MFERQDSNSKINVLLTMDDSMIQVVPTCTTDTLPTCVQVEHEAIFAIPTCMARGSDYGAGCSEYVIANISSDAINTASFNDHHLVSGQLVDSSGINSAAYEYILGNSGIKDPNLMEAAKRAIVDGDITPLIKEELKYTIQSKRLKEGKEELKVEFTDPLPDQLRPDEVERVEKRKVQNRLAARRFRDRQKSRGDTLQKECRRLEAAQTQLKFELSKAKMEKEALRKALDEHLAWCPLRYPPQFYTHRQSDNT